jgi:hypothetical protein
MMRLAPTSSSAKTNKIIISQQVAVLGSSWVMRLPRIAASRRVAS